MANYGKDTRKQQVLRKLQSNIGDWVDGIDLATAAVGGSEGLKRLRELREEGYPIEQRPHPDHRLDIWQYRLLDQRRVKPKPAPAPAPTTPGMDLLGALEEKPKPVQPAPVRSERGISEAIKRNEDGSFSYVPTEAEKQQTALPPDPAVPVYKFKRMPAHVGFGEVAVCPRCHGRTGRSAGTDVDGVALHKDPYQRSHTPCERCNGYGLIPNVGPVPFTPPEKL